MSDDISYASITDVATLIKARKLSPVELTIAALERIERLQPVVNSHITILAENALQHARAMDQLLEGGTYLGPLHGIPVTVKDNIAAQGFPTTAGSPILADSINTFSATVVARLQSAGAILIAKDNLYDFAYNAPNPRFGETHNPWNLRYTCGGSTSGSAAAVAAGMSFGALGTDGGGSIRIPASFCGVVGVKPTFGRVSRWGELAFHPNLSVVGPIARTVHDAAILLRVIAGPDDADPLTLGQPPVHLDIGLDRGVENLRLGVIRRQMLEFSDPEVCAAVESAYSVLEAQGAKLIDVELPDLASTRTILWIVSGSEIAEYLRPYIRSRPGDFNPITRYMVEGAEFIPATEYIHAQRLRKTITMQVREAFSHVDAVLLPTAPATAYAADERSTAPEAWSDDPIHRYTFYTAIFNLTGQPALTLPCGFSSTGMPIGLQVAGRPFEESTVFQVAKAYERATDWHLRRPSLALN